jgi:hypothetical protein
MPDGVNFVQTQEQPEQTPEQESNVKIVPVRNSLASGTRMVARGENGRFARSRARLDKELRVTEKVEDDLRALLTKPATDAEGKPKVDAKGKTIPLHIAVAEHLLNMALTLKDEKAIGAAGKTLESIMTRGLGKPSDSAVTREALKTQGISVIVIPVPDNLMHPEPVQEKPREVLKPPSWAKAEVVSTNPKKNSDTISE